MSSVSSIISRRSKGKVAFMFKVFRDFHSNKGKGEKFCRAVYQSIGWNERDAHDRSCGMLSSKVILISETLLWLLLLFSYE